MQSSHASLADLDVRAPRSELDLQIGSVRKLLRLSPSFLTAQFHTRDFIFFLPSGDSKQMKNEKTKKEFGRLLLPMQSDTDG